MAAIYKGNPTTNTGNYYNNDKKNTGGHSIKDNGTVTTTRESLNFIDLDIQDNSVDNSTDISAHELTNEEMAEIFANPPGTPTQQQNGNTAGGHTIKDNGTDMTTRSALNFVDFDLSDNSENDDTEVSAHRLTSEELSEILSEPPATSSNLPVMFDERGTEYQVGWYVLANGTKKPVYRKDYNVHITSKGYFTVDANFVSSNNVDTVIKINNLYDANKAAYFETGDPDTGGIATVRDGGKLQSNISGSGSIDVYLLISVYFTKTTDAPI